MRYSDDDYAQADAELREQRDENHDSRYEDGEIVTGTLADYIDWWVEHQRLVLVPSTPTIDF